MLKVLWIEDDMDNIEEYTGDSFDNLFGEPIVPISFRESFEYTEDNLAYDLVVIDIDLNKFNDFNSPYVEEIKEQIQFEPKQAGIVLFIKLLEQGFPKDQVLFLTGNAGSQDQTYDEFERYFSKALMSFPDYIFKDGNAPNKLSKNLESRQTQYLTLRRGIIEGCIFLKSHIEENEDNIQFRDFIKKDDTDNPAIEIETTEIINYLDTLAQFLPIVEPKGEQLNIKYRLFLRTLVHGWENNIYPDQKGTPKDINTFARISKITRNWTSHANLLEPLDTQIVAFLFLVNMRAMFKLSDTSVPYRESRHSYEDNLLTCISSPTEIDINLENYIDKTEEIIDEILHGLRIPEYQLDKKSGKILCYRNGKKKKKYFDQKINAIYEYNTGDSGAEKFKYKQYLLQYFWVNQKEKVNLGKLTAKSDDFLPTLARHIYKASFDNL